MSAKQPSGVGKGDGDIVDQLIENLASFSEHCQGKSITATNAAGLLGTSTDALRLLLKQKKDDTARHAEELVYNAVVARAMAMLNKPMEKAKAPVAVRTAFESCNDAAFQYLNLAKQLHQTPLEECAYSQPILDTIALMEAEMKEQNEKQQEKELAASSKVAAKTKRKSGRNQANGTNVPIDGQPTNKKPKLTSTKTADIDKNHKTQGALYVPLTPTDPNAPRFGKLYADMSVSFDPVFGFRISGVCGCKAWMIHLDPTESIDLSEATKQSATSAAVNALPASAKGTRSILPAKLATSMMAFIKKVIDAIKQKNNGGAVFIPEPIVPISTEVKSVVVYQNEQSRPLKLLLKQAFIAANVTQYYGQKQELMVKSLKLVVGSIAASQHLAEQAIIGETLSGSVPDITDGRTFDRTSSDIQLT